VGELEKVPHPQKFEPPFLEKFVSDFSLNLRISSGRGHVSIRNFGKSQEFYQRGEVTSSTQLYHHAKFHADQL